MMRIRRTPEEEKRLDYERQHFSPGKNDKAFRKNWPRKKALSERQYRHKVSLKLSRTPGLEADELQSAVAEFKREPIKKWSIINLRERVRAKKEKRQQMVGAHKKRSGRRR